MKRLKDLSLLLFMGLIIASCDNDDSLNPVTDPVLDNVRYDLEEVGDSGVTGDVVFNEQADGSVQLIVEVQGTSSGNMHPAHIHMNSAAQGGAIIVDLEDVDGATGLSITNFSTDIDGNPISFDDIKDLDAYVNVHLSADQLDVIVAQGDIGQNAFTGQSKTYELAETDVEGISGSITFQERENGFALATIAVDGTPANGMHPAHIHENSAIIGGGILFTFNVVDGSTGISKTDTRESAMDGEASYTYDDILDIDGYVNVHLSAEELGVIVAQGDIGSNELTGNSKSYDLEEKDVDGISGSILFEERKNGFSLATISLDGTPDDGIHPAHIHENSAILGGGILYTFNPVNGETGMSKSDTRLGGGEDESSYTYDDILEIDGYVNVHLSAEELGIIVAQGDIGSNELTGESITYTLSEAAVPGIDGEITFEERMNGFALATISLEGTPDDGEHPAHIHSGQIVDNGPIVFTFNIVNGETGMSVSDTRLGQVEGEASFSYSDILEIAGYVNVHLSAEDLDTIVAQGDIGSNQE